MVAVPPIVSATLLISKALTRGLSEIHPQNTRPIVLVIPITDNRNALFSGVQPFHWKKD